MIPFALSKDRKLVSIQEVLPGLACNCICPACESPLIARKGRRNAHHFAHYRNPECPGALESSLHLMAKSILKRKGKIVLPPIFLHGQSSPVEYASLFQFGGVRLEKYQDGLVPDIILETAAKSILVEIAVHHPAGSGKIWKLQRAGLTAIEIDVKAIYLELAGLGKGTDLAVFTDKIVNGIQHKKWLFNPKQHALENRIRAQADRKKVKHRVYHHKEHYLVDACPLYKRFRRNGPRAGRSYANVFLDCLSCRCCFEIEYHKKHVGYRRIVTQPEYVYCLGVIPSS